MLALIKAFASTQKLSIKKQPKPIFVNQQYGKSHCLHIVLSVNGVSPAGLAIRPTLTYAKSLEVPQSSIFRSKKSNKELFEILSIEDFDNKGDCKISFRINDVSRRHRGQNFCVCVALLKGDEYPRHRVHAGN